MRLVSWNVNGLRAVSGRQDLAWAFGGDSAADVVCLQETKIQPDAITRELRSPKGYERSFWSHHATKKGYSGTAIYVRDGLSAVPFDFKVGGAADVDDHADFDAEGRVVAVDLTDFVLINLYCPNGGQGGDRLSFKHAWHDALLARLVELKKTRAVVVCGDFNVAHRPIDLAFPDRWAKYSGFLPEERAWFDRLLQAGFIDSFRAEKGDLPRQFTFWETRVEARKDNHGWRIDYFAVDTALEDRLLDAWTSPQIFGSDHCPVGVELQTSQDGAGVVVDVVEDEEPEVDGEAGDDVDEDGDEDGASRWRR